MDTSLKEANDPDFSPEQAAKILNALGAKNVLEQVAAAAARTVMEAGGISGSFSQAQYDTEGRLVSYRKRGVLHTITYDGSSALTINSELGDSKTVQFDGSGRVVSIT
jgi:hypothetical protein